MPIRNLQRIFLCRNFSRFKYDSKIKLILNRRYVPYLILWLAYLRLPLKSSSFQKSVNLYCIFLKHWYFVSLQILLFWKCSTNCEIQRFENIIYTQLTVMSFLPCKLCVNQSAASLHYIHYFYLPMSYNICRHTAYIQ